MAIKIRETDCQFEREYLKQPLGFKGGYLRSIWQSVAFMEDDAGVQGIGLGTQSVLWSDNRVFASTPESGGNCLMFAITSHALRLAEGQEFETPIDLLDQIFDDVYDYAKKITGQPQLRKTFALNALVPVDNAAWVLYARKHNVQTFYDMIPEDYREAFSYQHDKVASIPIVSYGMSPDKIRKLIEVDGHFVLKFKLGSPGTQREMLKQDKARIKGIHDSIGDLSTKFTGDGKIMYYFDPNGRYESRSILKELLDYTKEIGAFEQIKILEEPFPEEYKADVGDLGLTVAADESVHNIQDLRERIRLGYQAIALKPIAKTLSLTIKMAREAHKHSIDCFCADLTVNPVMVDWNKNVAAHLAPAFGLKTGLLESNGHQNYRNWEQMKSYHSMPEASWINPCEGVYTLGKNFYEHNGGILKSLPHYESLLGRSIK